MTTFDRIKKISKEHGWSLQKLAEKAGLGINSIYRWKNMTPTTESLAKVAEVLGVSVDYLLGNTNNPNSDKLTEREVEITDKHVIMTYEGKPIPEEDMEIIKRLLRGK